MKICARAWPVAFSMLALAAPARCQDPDVHESGSWGFRVVRPGPEWSFVPAAASDSGYRLDLSRRSTGAVIGARVTVVRDDGGGVDALLRQTQTVAGSDDRYSGLRRIRGQVAARETQGIEVVYRDPSLGEFRIRQHYLVANGLRFTLQCHAPVDRFAECEAEFERFRKSFELQALSEEAAAEARLLGLVARCGSEVDWAPSWDVAAGRAVEGRRPVLVLVRRYPGFNIPNQMMSGPFMDRDVVALVRERFVALHLRDGMPAPFRSQASYGMSGTTFGNALLVVTPDGEVLRETHVANATACYDFLVESLRAVPELPAGHVPEQLADIERAERALHRGELEVAARLCAEPSTVREHLVLAGIHRLRRDASAALAALRAARAIAGSDADLRRIRLDEVSVHLGTGDPGTAREVLDAMASDDRATQDAAEPTFLRGVCALAEGRRDVGVELMQRLVAAHPETRWAWQAAAFLTSPALALDRPIRIGWPTEEFLAGLRTPPPAGDAPRGEVVRDALRYLLDAQRADGSWISPGELGSVRVSENPFVVAITALGGRSLLQRRDADGTLRAAARALTFVLRAHEEWKASPPRAAFMDYTVWSESLALWFLADCVEGGLGDADDIETAMAEKVATLADKRRPSAGWSYYVTGDLAKQGTVPEQAMSFTTAAVVIGLLRARDVGVAVGPDVIDGGLDCLERGRNDNGAFDYMVGTQPGSGQTGRPGAAGRGPLCELALARGGRGDLDRIRGALEIFREHRAGLHKELGKALMHAGPDGQGCHYLFFDYTTAAAAVAELPEDERARHRDWLLELILPARSVEGGFRDTPINGWAFGTAMALTAFWELGVG